MNAAMPAPRALRLVRLVEGGPGALGGRGVGQHGVDRRLVRHQRGDVAGVGRDQFERGHRTAAAGEHVDRPGAERLDQQVQVSRLLLRRVVGPAVLADAAAQPARVVGDDRAVGEVRRRARRSPPPSSAGRS